LGGAIGRALSTRVSKGLRLNRFLKKPLLSEKSDLVQNLKIHIFYKVNSNDPVIFTLLWSSSRGYILHFIGLHINKFNNFFAEEDLGRGVHSSPAEKLNYYQGFCNLELM
jgi:hypothetical protein